MNLKKSKCKGNWLHKFQILGENPFYVFERCERCGKKELFRKINGRIDNYAYAASHMREILQQWHPLYKHEHQQHLPR